MSGTWVRFTIRLDPWSYQNLLLKQAILKQGKPDISRAGTLRYILRRLRFTQEQKAWYTEHVNEILAAEEPEALRALAEAPPSDS